MKRDQAKPANTMANNLRYAARNSETVWVGGGEFTPEECREVAAQLEAFPGLLAACEAALMQYRADTGKVVSPLQQLLRDAIAKATGGAK